MITKINMFATSSLLTTCFPFGHFNLKPMAMRASSTVSKVAMQYCAFPDAPTLANAFHGGGKPCVTR